MPRVSTLSLNRQHLWKSRFRQKRRIPCLNTPEVPQKLLVSSYRAVAARRECGITATQAPFQISATKCRYEQIVGSVHIKTVFLTVLVTTYLVRFKMTALNKIVKSGSTGEEGMSKLVKSAVRPSNLESVAPKSCFQIVTPRAAFLRKKNIHVGSNLVLFDCLVR